MFRLDPDKLPKCWTCLVCNAVCQCERCIERRTNKLNQEPKESVSSKKTIKKDTKNAKNNDETKKVSDSEKKKTTKLPKESLKEKKKPGKSKLPADNEEIKTKTKDLAPKSQQKSIKEPKQEMEEIEVEADINPTGKRKGRPTKAQSAAKKAKESKEENNIVKIPMKKPEQAIPIIPQSFPMLQNQYIMPQNMELFNQQRMAYPLISQQMALGNFQNQPFNPLISQPVTGVETNQATSGMQGGAQSNTKPAKVKGTRGRKKKVENDNKET